MFLWNRKKETVWITAVSEIGNVRETNQDNLYLMEPIWNNVELEHFKYVKKCKLPILCAVCDGMGGGRNGEKASYMAASVLAGIETKQLETLSDNQLELFFRKKIQMMNDGVYYAYKDYGCLTGSTVTIFYADRTRVWIINVGDSPCLMMTESGLQVIAELDNRANQLYRLGIITEQEQWKHKSKNQLIQFIGMNNEEVQLSPHFYKMEYPEKSTTYVVSSDGLIDGLQLKEIEKILRNTKKEKMSTELVKKSLEGGSRDNVTVIVVNLEV